MGSGGDRAGDRRTWGSVGLSHLGWDPDREAKGAGLTSKGLLHDEVHDASSSYCALARSQVCMQCSWQGLTHGYVSTCKSGVRDQMGEPSAQTEGSLTLVGAPGSISGGQDPMPWHSMEREYFLSTCVPGIYVWPNIF